MSYENMEADFTNLKTEKFNPKVIKYKNIENIELDFTFVNQNEKVKEEINRKSFTFAEDAWRKLKQNKLSIIGLIFIIFITTLAIVVPIFSKYSIFETNLGMTNQFPSAAHWFGTDQLGRDIFVRVMYGARYSLAIAFIASFLNLIIGILYGGISGYFGGRVDVVMMRIVDIIYSIPMTIYVILIMVTFEKGGFLNIVLALALSYWIGMARIVRGEILQLKQQEYILAAKTLGASNRRILFKHLLPNSMSSIIVTLTLQIPSAIFTEAFLSFIGLGITPPAASWGTLANDALGGFRLYPYQLVFPTLAICLTILAFNLLGDGLRDALDPKVRG
ncbi:ABC transporter permease [Candidatus Cetobacterium colombiensis]|uniref:ABC transporter permease n=1 Tax=Candidatus Cetobacterium colombiensis TaxID=3073100 RepID=A0ABU4WA50_9FUSO|nr:ABC transporter permease [Candidatus Cetobacterium colombiensis]MDX8335574.1 ABC transporter permease [Candidatus Cetobacterium colombiensis]